MLPFAAIYQMYEYQGFLVTDLSKQGIEINSVTGTPLYLLDGSTRLMNKTETSWGEKEINGMESER